MKLTADPQKFDAFQEVLVQELIEQIRFKLAQSGISGDKLQEITGEIAFSIASILDDTTGMETDGEEVHPYLTFHSGESDLVHCGENAYTYEFLNGIFKEMFER